MSYSNKNEANASMWSRADTFHHSVLEYGGRLFLETMDAEATAMFLPVHRRISEFISMFDGTPCEDFLSSVLFDFIFNPTINAICKPINSGYVIGINSGFVDTIWRYFFTVLSHPYVMPQLEEEGYENQIDEQLATSGFDPFESLSDRSAGYMLFKPLPIPRGKIKSMLAFSLSVIATNYIFLHELGHIVNGHCDEVNKRFGFETFPENLTERQHMPLQTTLYHNMEFIADRFASIVSLANNQISHEYIDAFLPATEKLIGVPSEHSKFFFWSFAINSVLQLLSQRPASLDASDKSHPHPQVRLCVNEITIALLDILNERPDHESLLTQLSRGRRAVAVVWRELRIPGHEFDPYENDENLRRVISVIEGEHKGLEGILNVMSPYIKKEAYNILTRGSCVSLEYTPKDKTK